MTNQEKHHIKELLQRLRENNLTKEEISELDQILYKKGGAIETLLDEDLLHASNETSTVDSKRLWNSIKKRTIDIAQEKESSTRLTNVRRVYRYVAVAASILLVIGSAFFLMRKSSSPTSQYIQLEVNAGEKPQNFRLPDGTKIWLNAASSLEYKFDEEREVKLLGEAFFEVTKNTKSPFKVHFGNNELIVTGTQFNIKAYENQGHSQVHVKEGSVNVSNANNSTQLVQNDYLLINETTGEQYKKHRIYKEAETWTKGQLVFHDSPLIEVFKSIERQYDVSITIKKRNKATAQSITATYPISTKLKDLMDGLEYLEEIKYDFITPDSLVVTY